MIRPATVADLPAIERIQAASPEASHWAASAYLAHHCMVADVEPGQVAGFLVSRETGPGEREILNLAVDPAARRKGIGRALVAAEFAGRSGTWFLEVRAANLIAHKFYETIGFQQVGVRKEYYANPRDSAIVMRIFS